MNQYLFLGYGPISKRVISQLTNSEYPKIHLITDRSIGWNLPNNVQIWKSTDAENLVRATPFDFVINSWRTLSTPSLINRKRFLTLLARSESRLARVFNFSSVAVYGNHDRIHFETSSVDPINSYGLDKLEIELFMQKTGFFQVHNLRISNVFGDPDLRDVVNRIIFAARNRSEIFLSEPKYVFRDFIFMDDVVNVIFKIIKSPSQIPFETINVARGNSISLFELFEICKCYLSKKPNFSNIDLRSDEIRVSRVNNVKLQSQYPMKLESIQFQLKNYITGLQL